MAPLDDLIYLILIAFKDGFHTTVPAVFDPALQTQLESHILSMITEEDPLDPSFNDCSCPHFFHKELSSIKSPLTPPSPLWGEGEGEEAIKFENYHRAFLKSMVKSSSTP
jgi:hypothetical protein